MGLQTGRKDSHGGCEDNAFTQTDCSRHEQLQMDKLVVGFFRFLWCHKMQAFDADGEKRVMCVNHTTGRCETYILSHCHVLSVPIYLQPEPVENGDVMYS